MSLIFTEARLVFLVGSPLDNWKLDLQGCAVLSRLVNRRPDRVVMVADPTVPPYTHTVVLGQAVFRVQAVELTPTEAEAAGLSRQVSAEDVAGAGLQRPLRAAVVTARPSPGESIQEAMDHGLAGWRWRP